MPFATTHNASPKKHVLLLIKTTLHINIIQQPHLNLLSQYYVIITFNKTHYKLFAFKSNRNPKLSAPLLDTNISHLILNPPANLKPLKQYHTIYLKVNVAKTVKQSSNTKFMSEKHLSASLHCINTMENDMFYVYNNKLKSPPGIMPCHTHSLLPWYH